MTVVGVDDEDTEDAAFSLRDELAHLPVDAVDRPAAGPAPPGTRAGELVEVGTVLIGLVASPEVVGGVLVALQEWLVRRRRGRLEITVGSDTLVLDNPSPEQQRKIVDAFVERVLGR